MATNLHSALHEDIIPSPTKETRRKVVMSSSLAKSTGPNNQSPLAGSDQAKSKTACQRCRDQKLKCSRDYPICFRCKRLNGLCSYPKLASRRRFRPIPRVRGDEGGLASACGPEAYDVVAGPTPQSEQYHSNNLDENRTVPSYTQAAISTFPVGSSTEDGTSSPHFALDKGGQDASPLSTLSPDTYHHYLRNVDLRNVVLNPLGSNSDPPPAAASLPPLAAGLVLLEIYFSRIYNAPLLFVKSALFQDYIEGCVPDVLLKSIFALASLFLVRQADRHQNSRLSFSELNAVGVFHTQGRPWAESAMQDAMSSIMVKPSLAIVQTLECLVIYWFGVGESDRGDLCLSLAYRYCRLSRYYEPAPPSGHDSEACLQSELKRRCLWACWASLCIVVEPKPYIKAAWSEVANLPLPGSIISTSGRLKIVLCEKMDENWGSTTIGDEIANQDQGLLIVLGLMKMIGVWAKIQLYASELSADKSRRSLPHAQHLSELASSIYHSLDFGHLSSEDNPSLVKFRNQAILVECLYYLCQMVLHSTNVFLFSGCPADSSISDDVVQASATVVVHNADLSGQFFERLWAQGSDVTRLCPLAGYAAFVTAVMLMISETWCQQQNRPLITSSPEKRRNRMAAMKAILKTLDILRGFWQALQRPWETLNVAMQMFHTHEEAYRSRRINSQQLLSRREFEQGGPNSDNYDQLLILPNSRTPSGPTSSPQFHPGDELDGCTSYDGCHQRNTSGKAAENILTDQLGIDDAWWDLSLLTGFQDGNYNLGA
ncbi:hypothetical protein BU24DRAFT_50654 [Aaosphaeria arxii CBS 175.79]|uniref:Zn(2)-C6 fungal-type domain-containing protein n=1 Tax=Aaosphaeria arxii CBS 175.79 TaxID=1450172 RepID=A0A6A5XDP8_9PLEO|nr:uncharacterized protein BU24DRAFT_50654 [Aaosphaeria arxii CBS 175.79]KAF2010993.1 hypothetical protein BU24DRAFT_50654 [Aaosphaeria arxii CBS 175.79]